MRQYLNPVSIANTIRMMNFPPINSRVFLVEKDSDVRLVEQATDKSQYKVIPAFGHNNLIEVIDILHNDGWKIACMRINNTVIHPTSRPKSLQPYDWIPGNLQEIDQQARRLTQNQLCVAVLPTDTADADKQSTKPTTPKRTIDGTCLGSKKSWSESNARRVVLIKKQVQYRLTTEEQEELNSLQSEMSNEMKATNPLPFEALDWLEKCVKEAEDRLGKK